MTSLRFSRKSHLFVSVSLVLAIASVSAQTAEDCGQMVSDTQYGPYDYVTENDKVALVDKHHFPPHVEALIRPMWKAFGNDLSYTLQRIPNHHRALVTLSKLGLREKSPQPRGLRFPIDCYYMFATRFSPGDLVTKMIFAGHLVATSRQERAIPLLNQVVAEAGDNPLTHFNAGLIYFEMKRFDLARAQAQRARELGWQRPELVEMLKQAGQWQEP